MKVLASFFKKKRFVYFFVRKPKTFHASSWRSPSVPGPVDDLRLVEPWHRRSGATVMNGMVGREPQHFVTSSQAKNVPSDLTLKNKMRFAPLYRQAHRDRQIQKHTKLKYLLAQQSRNSLIAAADGVRFSELLRQPPAKAAAYTVSLRIARLIDRFAILWPQRNGSQIKELL